MAKYRVHATYAVYCYLDVEAESKDEAYEIATQTDGGDFNHVEYGDWNIDDVTRLGDFKLEESTELTNDNIKAYAKSLGYDFDDESCDALRAESHDGETVGQAVNDYLDAYER